MEDARLDQLIDEVERTWSAPELDVEAATRAMAALALHLDAGAELTLDQIMRVEKVMPRAEKTAASYLSVWQRCCRRMTILYRYLRKVLSA